MFTKEIPVVRNIAKLADQLYMLGDDMEASVDGMCSALENLRLLDMVSYEVSANFKSMVSAERELAKTLAQFDKVLARIIAERAKLG